MTNTCFFTLGMVLFFSVKGKFSAGAVLLALAFVVAARAAKLRNH